MISRLLCRFGFHKWAGPTRIKPGPTVFVITKRCGRCGKEHDTRWIFS